MRSVAIEPGPDNGYGTQYRLRILDGYRAGEFVRMSGSEEPQFDIDPARLQSWAEKTGYTVEERKLLRMDPRSIKHAIHALADAEADEFHVVCQNISQFQSGLRPKLLIVHPGDAIERACDWNDRATGEKVASLAMSNQAGMADEILAKLPTHDAIVLHRMSSMYLEQSDVHSNYRDALDQCEAVGVVLYGDDLETAAKWMLNNVPGMKVEGVSVFMTGAYADEEYGCITAVGKALLEANPELTVIVSEHAPTDNWGSLSRWMPQSGQSDRTRDHGPAPTRL